MYGDKYRGLKWLHASLHLRVVGLWIYFPPLITIKCVMPFIECCFTFSYAATVILLKAINHSSYLILFGAAAWCIKMYCFLLLYAATNRIVNFSASVECVC